METHINHELERISAKKNLFFRFTRRQSIEILLLRQSTFLLSPSLRVCMRHARLPVTARCCLVEGVCTAAGCVLATARHSARMGWNLREQ